MYFPQAKQKGFCMGAKVPLLDVIIEAVCPGLEVTPYHTDKVFLDGHICCLT